MFGANLSFDDFCCFIFWSVQINFPIDQKTTLLESQQKPDGPNSIKSQSQQTPLEEDGVFIFVFQIVLAF